jgi:serine O-acetyltransferase
MGLRSRLDQRLGAAPPSAADERWFGHIRDDFRAHGSRWGAQGFWALVVYRLGRWRYGIRTPLLRKPCSALYHVLYKLVQILTGIELPCEARIGHHFVIDHFGGIVVSGYARFGDNCRIRQGVTVGLARVDDPCAPTIGDNVDIGAGAKLLGRIVIGNHVLIGANAVVITDVPSHCTAAGVPAIVRRRGTTGRVARGEAPGGRAAS